MNEQQQTQQKRSNVLVLVSGGAMLLIGLLVFTASWIALYGQGDGQGFELLFVELFVVLPLLVMGGLLILRRLMRKRSSVILLIVGGVTLLIDYLVSSLPLPGNEYPYSGVGEISAYIASLIGPTFFFIGGWLVLEGLIRLAIQLAKKMFKRSNTPLPVSDDMKLQHSQQPQPEYQPQPPSAYSPDEETQL